MNVLQKNQIKCSTPHPSPPPPSPWKHFFMYSIWYAFESEGGGEKRSYVLNEFYIHINSRRGKKSNLYSPLSIFQCKFDIFWLRIWITKSSVQHRHCFQGSILIMLTLSKLVYISILIILVNVADSDPDPDPRGSGSEDIFRIYHTDQSSIIKMLLNHIMSLIFLERNEGIPKKKCMM